MAPGKPSIHAPVEFDLIQGAPALYVFFGGIASGIAMPPFEFYNASKILDASRIFVRDFRQCWYHAGLPGISHDIPSTAAYLAEQIARLGPQRVVFVGNSMGGFAAMLFAAMLGGVDAIAFAPQTFVSPGLRLRHRDTRWARQIGKVWWQGLRAPRFWDVRPALATARGKMRVSVFYSPGDALDRVHARRLEGLPQVRVHEIPGGRHNMVKLLRDNGSLPAIMAGTFEAA